MIKAILIGVGTAFLLGLAYALITRALCRKSASLRTLALITAGLVVLHHLVAGLASFYGKPVSVDYALFRTVIIPWSYGFGYGPTAFWCALAIQALIAALLGAGICAVLTIKRRKMMREQGVPGYRRQSAPQPEP